jgi:hypothetical protein
VTSISWNAEGGSNGTTITTGNSGGASGTAWDTVSIVTNGTAVYDTGTVLTGAVSARLATGATSGTVYCQWQSAIQALWASGLTTHYGRRYIRVAALPSANRVIAQFYDTSGAIARGQFLLLTTGAIRLRNKTPSTVATFTTVLSVDTTYRLEWRVDGSATGAYEMHLFAGDSTSALESIVGGTADFGGTIGTAAFGWLTAGANVANQWLDGVQLNDTGLPGPETSALTVYPNSIAVTAGLGSPTAAASATAAPSGISVTAGLGSPTAAFTEYRHLDLDMAPPEPKWTAGAPGAKWLADPPAPKWTVGIPD